VEIPQTPEEWIAVRHHVAFDTVLTAMITLTWLRAQGYVSVDTPAAIYQLADWFLRRTGDETRMAAPLAELRMRMAEQMAEEFATAA